LRERVEDIPALADHFISVFASREKKPGLSIAKDAMQLLQRYSWHGNTRELRNVIERAVVLSDGDKILPEHLPYEIQRHNSSSPDNLSLSSVEKKHIEKVLTYTKGNKTKAAEFLGIGLTTLYRKLEEYHIEK